jgi:hypothetical protein
MGRALSGGAGEAREGLLFVNKKKQKNFINLGDGRCRRHRLWPGIEEVFARFFQKALLPSRFNFRPR